MAKKCSIEGCCRTAYGKGLCRIHLYHYNKYGDATFYAHKKEKTICKASGCKAFASSKGYCSKHWARIRRHGSSGYASLSKDSHTGVSITYKAEFNSYRSMRARCYSRAHECYDNYGGRGIKVCDRWLGKAGFRHFLEDMGEKPEPKNKYSLDRIDPNGDYCKANCRWATRVQQSNNMRNNRIIEYDGESHTIAEWGRKKELSQGVIYNRIMKLNWPIEKALETPLLRRRRR